MGEPPTSSSTTTEPTTPSNTIEEPAAPSNNPRHPTVAGTTKETYDTCVKPLELYDRIYHYYFKFKKTTGIVSGQASRLLDGMYPSKVSRPTSAQSVVPFDEFVDIFPDVRNADGGPEDDSIAEVLKTWNDQTTLLVKGIELYIAKLQLARKEYPNIPADEECLRPVYNMFMITEAYICLKQGWSSGDAFPRTQNCSLMDKLKTRGKIRDGDPDSKKSPTDLQFDLETRTYANFHHGPFHPRQNEYIKLKLGPPTEKEQENCISYLMNMEDVPLWRQVGELNLMYLVEIARELAPLRAEYPELPEILKPVGRVGDNSELRGC